MDKERKTIRLVGKQIVEDNDYIEIEDGFCEIETNVDEVLNEIDGEDLVDFAKDKYNLKHEDEFESNLDDFDDDDLIEELDDRSYDFYKHIRDEDYMIELLEEKGYVVSSPREIMLDIYDENNLCEIIKKFHNATFEQREKIYELVIGII